MTTIFTQCQAVQKYQHAIFLQQVVHTILYSHQAGLKEKLIWTLVYFVESKHHSTMINKKKSYGSKEQHTEDHAIVILILIILQSAHKVTATQTAYTK